MCFELQPSYDLVGAQDKTSQGLGRIEVKDKQFCSSICRMNDDRPPF